MSCVLKILLFLVKASRSRWACAFQSKSLLVVVSAQGKKLFQSSTNHFVEFTILTSFPINFILGNFIVLIIEFLQELFNSIVMPGPDFLRRACDGIISARREAKETRDDELERFLEEQTCRIRGVPVDEDLAEELAFDRSLKFLPCV